MRKISLLVLLAALALTGAGCSLLSSPQVQAKPVTLNYWRADDPPESMAAVIEAYRKMHPNVVINYQKFSSADYERKLLEAFAENRGPDIFSIPNVDLRGWKAKIQPMPKEVQLPTVTVDAQKRIVTVNKKTPTMTIRELRDSYVEAVIQEVVMLAPPEKVGGKPEDKIFGLPLSLDSLALFYNRDLLKKANIEKPPVLWNDFLTQVQALTVLEGTQGDIRQAGAALGTADNVRHFVDIIAAIMMQNGAIMDEAGYMQPTKYNADRGMEGTYPPGVQALMFYVNFAEAGTANYTWNDKMPNSLDAFVTGKTAFYFGYPVDVKEIHDRAPRLDFGVAPLPQVDLNYVANVANFPIEVVAKKTKYPNETWDFIQFLAQPDQVKSFLLSTKRPTALRSLINDQKLDPDLAAFVDQVLTAKTWYRGSDYEKAQEGFAYMVNTKPTYEQPSYIPIVDMGANMVNQTVTYEQIQ